MANKNTPMEVAHSNIPRPVLSGSRIQPPRPGSNKNLLPQRPNRRPKTDADGFTVPNSRNAAKPRTIKAAAPIALANDYSSLSEGESEPPSPALKKRKRNNQPAAPQEKLPTADRAMPIKVHRASIDQIKNIMTPLTLSKPPEFSTMRNPEDRKKVMIQVLPKSSSDKKKILEALKVHGIECYSHCERDERRKLFVLKGHTPITTEDLLATLVAHKIPAKTVSKIGRSDEDPIFLVGFEQGSISYDTLINQHRIIDHLRIKWEKHTPRKKRYMQCSNCQRWGHGKANCNMQRRCIKCQEHHEVGECARQTTTEGEPFCVNCKQSGHPANSTTCEVYKRHVAAIEKRKKLIQHQPRRFESTPAPWGSQTNINHFPSFTPVNRSTNQSQPIVTTESKREYRSFLTQSQNTQPQSSQNLGQSRSMRDEILGLEGMVETLNLYRTFISEFNLAKSYNKKLLVLIKYDLQALLSTWV
jgi:hypothetical protein